MVQRSLVVPPRWKVQINLEALPTCVETSACIFLGSPSLLTCGAYATVFEDEDIVVLVISGKTIVGRALKGD